MAMLEEWYVAMYDDDNGKLTGSLATDDDGVVKKFTGSTGKQDALDRAIERYGTDEFKLVQVDSHATVIS